MSREFAEPIKVGIAPSRTLRLLTGLLHGGALVLVPFLSVPVAARLVLAVAIVAVYFLTRRASAVEELLFGADGSITARLAGESEDRPCLLTVHALGEWLVLLSVRPEGGKRSFPLALAADSVEPDIFRRVRARLWRSNPAG